MTMRVITKISVGTEKTVTATEVITKTKAGAKQKIFYSNRVVDTRKQAIQSIEKAVFYALLLFMAVFFIKEDAVQAFSGKTTNAHLLIDGLQTVLLVLCSVVAFAYSFSKRSDSYQSIFALLFGLGAYALLIEQGTLFISTSHYVLWCVMAAVIVLFTGMQLYRNRHFLVHDFEMYFKTKSYPVAWLAVLSIIFLPYMFNDEVFMKSHLNEMPASFGEMLTEYVQTFGYVFFLIAITELVIKVKQQNKIEDIFK